jgi:signal transduction histidine kinase
VKPQDPKLDLHPAEVPQELEPIVRTTVRLLDRVRGELTRQRELTADVAHDLRTPVAGVRALLDVCLQRERSSPEYVAAMEKARGALRELSRLLDDVLALARLDARADEPVWTRVSVDDPVAAAIATVQPLAAARGVEIEFSRSAPAELRTDHGKLVKILSNLLSNAVEHSPRGETVRLAVHADNGSLEIAVADRGPGVPERIRPRVFDRFARGDTARGTDGHHGLGLPIAAGLARLLHGEITLDVAYQRGARFVVRLPSR